MKKLICQAFGALILLTLMAGCAGYQLGAVKPAAYRGVERIFVPPFKNETLEPRISSLVTNAVLKQLQVDGTYQVSRENDADAVLRGTIQEIRKNQLRGSRTDTIRSEELYLLLYVRWHLEKPNGEPIVCQDRGPRVAEAIQNGPETVRTSPGVVIGTTVQFVDPSFQVGERNAIAMAAEDAARKLVAQMSEGW